MGRHILHRLTAGALSRITKPGYHADGGGLWLQVSKSGSKSWVFFYTRNKRTREMGLGSVKCTTLADVRAYAFRLRQQLQNGIDPLESRNAAKLASKLTASTSMTFEECAAAFIASHRGGWKNRKHAEQWENTLSRYAAPVLGLLPVSAVNTAAVLRCLEPIWHSKTETASRLRGRIEQILDWAAAREMRSRENPARWRGHLDKLLPAKAKTAPVVHHAAMPYQAVPTFLARLHSQDGNAARAFEFCILTACRTSEVMGACWNEFDLASRVWTVPAERMKAGRAHRVPLSDRCMVILAGMKPASSGFVFGGRKPGRPLTNMAFLMILRRLGLGHLTAHGFRSTFRDWAADCTHYPNEVCEKALAHAVACKTEAAYRRGDLLERRGPLMADWAAYCTGKGG